MSKRGPKFDPQTRKRLHERFRREYFKARKRTGAVELRPDGTVPDYVNVLLDRDATVFVNCLANLARGRAEFSEVVSQKERRLNLRKIATHLDGLLDAVLEADNAALGYAYLRGIEEVMRTRGALSSDHQPLKNCDGYPGALDAEQWKAQSATDLKAFALGIRIAIKELPEIDRAHRSFDSYLAVQTARWLEDYLGRLWIPFTTSEDGLAAMAFRAVMELAGVDTSEAQGARYRLSEARKSPTSFEAFIAELRSRMTTAEKAP